MQRAGTRIHLGVGQLGTSTIESASPWCSQTRLLAIKPRSQWIKRIIDDNGKHTMQKSPPIRDGSNFQKCIHIQNSGQAF